MPEMSDLLALTGEIVSHLRELDIEGLPSSRKCEATVGRVDDRFAEQTRCEKPREGQTLTLFDRGLSKEGGEMSLDELRTVVERCVKCRLSETRTQTVFGVGNAKRPLIAFVGEGPGAEEDRQGEPFVGRAGQLLTAAITKGLGLRREDVYICNVVKCRPPENRTPLLDEVEACSPYLFRQLELVQPSVIVTLGQPAQLALCGVKQGITKIRGRWLSWRGVRVMPTFHPAYVLRNPGAKRAFWEDLQAVMRELGMR